MHPADKGVQRIHHDPPQTWERDPSFSKQSKALHCHTYVLFTLGSHYCCCLPRVTAYNCCSSLLQASSLNPPISGQICLSLQSHLCQTRKHCIDKSTIFCSYLLLTALQTGMYHNSNIPCQAKTVALFSIVFPPAPALSVPPSSRMRKGEHKFLLSSLYISGDSSFPCNCFLLWESSTILKSLTHVFPVTQTHIGTLLPFNNEFGGYIG